jgi:hypothetical protein
MFRFRSTVGAALTSLAILLMAGSTARASQIDFNIAPSSGPGGTFSGGVVSYAGGSSDLIGAIGSNNVTNTSTGTFAYLTSTSSTPGLSYTAAALNFSTGAYIASASTSTSWVFGSAGSSISITGDAYNSSTLTEVQTTTTLLTGSFNSNATVINQAGGAQQVVGVATLVVIDAGLAAYLGVQVGATWSGSITITLNAPNSSDPTNTPASGTAFSDGSVSGGNATVGNISGGNITMSPVPAPAGLVLALTALPCLGVGRWLRRRTKSN